MPYAIMINLDYDNRPHRECASVWQLISRHMDDAGFRHDARCFTSTLPEDDAVRLARVVLRRLEHELEARGQNIYAYVRDCYGFNTGCATNLLLPPPESIQVREERARPGAPPRVCVPRPQVAKRV